MGHHHLLPYIHEHSHHHHHHSPSADVPKGCVAVRVGKEGADEEEPQRFVVPVEYLNHPLFSGLLKVAEDEFGFDQKGTFTLPCRVAEFQSIQGLIHQDIHINHHHHHHHFRSNSTGSLASGHQHQHHQHHHLHLAGCFKA